MGSAGNGAKAGVIAGIAYGIILGIVGYFTLISIKSMVISVLSQNLPPNSPFTPEQLVGITLLLTPVIVTVVGVIGGLILGAIYGKLTEKIPGKSPVIKGIIFGSVLWLLVSVLGGYNNIQYGLEYYLVQVGTGLAGALLFGVLLGYFYGRFMRPKETYTMT
jgi:hypothetical protein